MFRTSNTSKAVSLASCGPSLDARLAALITPLNRDTGRCPVLMMRGFQPDEAPLPTAMRQYKMNTIATGFRTGLLKKQGTTSGKIEKAMEAYRMNRHRIPTWKASSSTPFTSAPYPYNSCTFPLPSALRMRRAPLDQRDGRQPSAFQHGQRCAAVGSLNAAFSKHPGGIPGGINKIHHARVLRSIRLPV